MVAIPDQALKAGQKLRDQGVTDPAQLAAAIAKAVPSAALVAGVAANRVLAKTGSPVAVAAAAVAKPVAAVVQPVTDAAAVARDAAELPTRVVRWLSEPGTWVRISYVIGGGALVLIALAIVAKSAVSSVAGSEVGKIAGKALGGKG